MNQEDARRVLDSNILDKACLKIREKLFSEFCKVDSDGKSWERLEAIHAYGAAVDKVNKELVVLLTNYSQKGKF
jgi:hypothetical protein